MRKTPFSGKQKKAQLQQKRKEKAQKHENETESTYGRVEADPQRTEDLIMEVGQTTVEYSADKGGVKSVFAKDTAAELELRRKAQYAPLLNRDFETGSGGSGIVYGQWFRIATLGGINDSPASALPPKFAGEGSDKTLVANGPYTATFPYSVALPTRTSLVNFDSVEIPCPEESDEAASESGLAGQERAVFGEWMSRIDTKFRPNSSNSPLAGLEVNQYERNIEVWRQLWRTVEQGDVILIVADARYPIIHLPASLLIFVLVVCKKRAVIVLNKVDLVPESRLALWEQFVPEYVASVLAGRGVTLGADDLRICRFTSNPASETTTAKEGENIGKRRKHKQNKNAKRYAQFKEAIADGTESDGSAEDSAEDPSVAAVSTFGAGAQFKGMEKAARDLHKDDRTHAEIGAVGRMVGKLFATCRGIAPASSASIHKDGHGLEGFLSIGLVGHPNVGKSNLINCLRGRKVVSVSSTAGHTKHLQHIPLKEEKITLIDCPGLAFPVLGVPRPMQAVIGTHQIAQTRDPQSAVAYLASRIPIEKVYALKKVGGDDDEPWSAYELCESYATKRGFHVKRGKGAVDTQRAAIAIITDAYEGRLVLSFQPPPLDLLSSKAFQEHIRPLLFSEVF